MLEIRLLGALEVRDGERVVEVRRRKQRALLAALALRAGDVVSPDRLVDDLWGERAPRTARHALENYVSDLRKTLGRDVIRTTASGYALDIAPRDQVDVGRFERLLSEAPGQAPAERSETYRAALSLVRGAPLEDLAFEPFAQTAVPRLHELELVAREELADAELELGRHAEVVVEVEPLVAANPYRERLRAQLMLALYRSGRQAEALAAYQEARRVLVEELGIDPGEELQELERAILRQDPSLRAPPRVRAQPSGGRATTTVAGRPARKTLAILVSELANVPTLADSLDPEPLRAVLDRYHAVCAAAIDDHGGVSRRLDGERVLAVFGFPATHEDDALRAVRAAVELREGVGALNDGLLSEHGVFLEARSAVTFGEVLVTPEGEELATGRPIVEARQLERQARAGQILIGESALPLLTETVTAEPLLASEADAPGASRLVELNPDVHGRVLRLDSPLVGRRRQLTALSGAFETAVANRALHLFTLLGTPGVGKSRLVREFTSSIESVATIRRGGCLAYGEPVTYWPLIDALNDTEDELTSADEPTAAFRSALERVALERPLVLVLDDLHWAEPALLDLVESIAESSRGAPALVLCVARPELLETRPTWGGGMPNASSMLLEPLNETECDRLIDNLLGESELPASVRDYLIRTADGNPLFVEELLAMLVDRDILTRKAGRWTTTSRPAVPVPATMQALIASRIDRLPEGERMVLELASVEGEQTFHRTTLVALAPPELTAEVDSHLTALIRKELVRPRPGEADVYAFRHELIREAAYSSMPMRTRAELHERLADLLEVAQPEPNVEALADYHRERARRYREKLGAAGPSD